MKKFLKIMLAFSITLLFSFTLLSGCSEIEDLMGEEEDSEFSEEDDEDGRGSGTGATITAKYIEVFGVEIYASEAVADEKVQHVAKVVAQYLDSNEDGIPDNLAVVAKLKESEPFIAIFATQAESDEFWDAVDYDEDYEDYDDYYRSDSSSDSSTDSSTDSYHDYDDELMQEFLADEILPNGAAEGQFDATLEKVLHLLTQGGYAVQYPDIFGEKSGSAVANAMDTARGGHYDFPAAYPDGAWFTSKDTDCLYACQVNQYTYWALTSLLGGQNFDGRLDAIKGEWTANTAEKVLAQDPAIHAILTDSQYHLPTVLPNATYNGGTFTIEIVQEEFITP
jgi:hypothetical protein